METRKNKITGNDIKDIHEKDKEYLKKSYENAIKVAKIKKWVIIDCVENDKMRSIDEINNLIFNKIKEELL